MNKCGRCEKAINREEMYKHGSEILCEDCYIDMLVPRVRKMYYENSRSNFMIRLKDSYIARPQRFH